MKSKIITACRPHRAMQAYLSLPPTLGELDQFFAQHPELLPELSKMPVTPRLKMTFDRWFEDARRRLLRAFLRKGAK